MLTSSRAFTHFPWRPVVGRIVRGSAGRFQQRLLGIAATRLAVALDPPDERSPSNPTRRSLFRKHAHSPQSLQLLLEEGKFREADTMLLELREREITVPTHPVYEKAVGNLLSHEVFGATDRELLILWLELLPDVRSISTNFLHNLVDDLRRHAKFEASIPMSVGRVLARKGYRTLVMEEILPLVKKTSNADSFVLFEQELARALAHFDSLGNTHTSTRSSQSEVFEDASEDYASVMANSAPPPPSLLEIIESTLPSILSTPSAIDQSVFEDGTSEDYIVHRTTSHHVPRQFPPDHLSRLVKRQLYDEAFYLLTEINQLHTEVPFSSTYGAAALEALKRPISDNYSLEEQQDRFTAWFSLIPPTHEAQDCSYINVIQQTIMQASLTNLQLVMRFTTILARKGYTGVQTQALPVIMRFASSDSIQQYIQELEAADSAYWTAYLPEDAAIQTRRFSAKLRSAAIRLLSYAGRVEDAITLIPDSKSGVRLTAHSYEKLLRTIRDSNNPSDLKYMARIRSLREEAAGPGDLAAAQTDRIFVREEDRAMSAELHTDSFDTETGNLPDTLQYLKRSLTGAKNSPHPFVIVEFLERYLATGRSRAPGLLLHRALNSSYHSASIFLFAEMLYYRRLGHHHLVIQTFVDHFYLSGVPRDDTLRLYDESHRLQTPHTDNLHSAEIEAEIRATRICKFSPSLLSRGKAWPMKIHCNLVWHALVALAPSHLELQHLYIKLINLARGHDELRAHLHHSSIQPLLPPPSWRQPIGCAAFTPFMRGLMHFQSSERGTQIISDMLDLGIEPSIYHFTELAGKFARRGELRRALMILDQLEAGSKLKERLQQQQRINTQDPPPGSIPPAPIFRTHTTPLPSEPEPTQFSDSNSESPLPSLEKIQNIPEPDLVMYISIMRGFVISRSIDGFEEVHKRLLAIRNLLPRKRFKRDQQAMLDEVYADYRKLCQQQRHDWRRGNKAGFKTWLEAERRRKEQH